MRSFEIVAEEGKTADAKNAENFLLLCFVLKF